MLYSTRAVVPPNGFVPYGGRRVDVAATSPSPSPSSSPSVIERLSLLLVPKPKAEEPLRRQALAGSDTSSFYYDSAVLAKARALAMGAVPLRRHRESYGLVYAYEQETLARGAEPMRRGC